MVIDSEGNTIWEGYIEATVDASTLDQIFYATREDAGSVVLVGEDKETVREVARRNLAKLQEERLKREHRRRR